jgi:ubiquinone/menaquinone biosynthesis C-methylase UbiE
LSGDAVFAGSIPEVYDTLLVPLIFEPYAIDLARRVAALGPGRVLEIAAGTGALTRALRRALPPEAELVATDLNAPMLDRAKAIEAARGGSGCSIQWRTADAMHLPFDDESFDVVACQFGAMFFPDKAHAFGEVRRVLRPGGAWVFNTWDRIEDNEFAQVVTAALAALYPAQPPDFMARTPHGYFEREAVEAQLVQAGFGAPIEWETVTTRSTAESARGPATAYCQGTPLRNEIESLAARGGASLDEATRASEAMLRARFGDGRVDGKIQAHVVVVRKESAALNTGSGLKT